ncbi:hypothetical protein PR202_gb03291 [Eleusine coracana subsp. coracana]|uniref:RING-type E3 ubiquitin transferase n=1 Tax=Eleusine coracana subsp. coracana TaxID=191504 RepID=A0AAV5E1G0_ELECO|nr:hypothetical protein QOZ80_8BG0658990 [Eleusine coracana subsp. coracana]GJN16245.1 hypothetical protein PR202_gb03210 [Eleusine coracana subsp. coracana]GJN16316.1 hypothetical protein PR202_gb03291 [Eleusine coracana subsp. coracana]
MPPPPPQKQDRGQPRRRRRRLLTLPTVCPCESIAPEPLLASLLSLAADVAGRGADAAAFPALRRGSGEAVRVAGLLLALLESTRESEPPVEDAAVLGLSELHVALQKLRLLLADLGRSGARLWVLLNAELAAAELRVALGSVATAMEALPPPPQRDDVDAAEIGRLVAEHAWRAAARVGPDPDDSRAARSVRSVLARFCDGDTPDADDAWLALRQLGIDTWSGCAEEAAFLESELLDRLDETNGEDDGNDLALLSGLLAFAVYCRVVLFDRIDEEKKLKKVGGDDVAGAARRQQQQASGVAAWVSRESLQCPITLEVMSDPVTISTGQTYDRASIKRWIKSGCRTCPVTGERLRSAELVPNLAARGIIEEFLRITKRVVSVSAHDDSKRSSKHRHAVDKTTSPFSAAAAGGARLAAAFLVAKLSSAQHPDQLLKATYEARKVSKRNALYRCCLVEANAVPWLLHLLASSDSSSVQDNAVAALLNLSKHPAGRTSLVQSGGVGLVVDAVNVAQKTEARQNAAAVLFYLSSEPEYREEIGRVPESVPTLVRLARDAAASYRGRKNALVSLYGLLQCQCAAVHAKAVAAGAVPVLAAILLSSTADDGNNDNDLAVNAVALLARLAERAWARGPCWPARRSW